MSRRKRTKRRNDNGTVDLLCYGCNLWKPLDNDYFVLDKNSADGFGSRCKKCVSGWRKNNPERSREGGWKRVNILCNGKPLSWEAFVNKLKEQDGKCAVCLVNLSVDDACADHVKYTDEFCGVLCDRCNINLVGDHSFDQFLKLNRAAEYIGRNGAHMDCRSDCCDAEHTEFRTVDPKKSNIRTFYLYRETDISGVSGTGIVATGAVFANGMVAISWLSDKNCVNVYQDVATAEAVHGHNGTTKFLFLPKSL